MVPEFWNNYPKLWDHLQQTQIALYESIEPFVDVTTNIIPGNVTTTTITSKKVNVPLIIFLNQFLD